jgi:hypothetical protein
MIYNNYKNRSMEGHNVLVKAGYEDIRSFGTGIRGIYNHKEAA